RCQGTRKLRRVGRGAVEAGAGTGQDRRGDAEQALLRSERARRPGVDPRFLQEGRRRARRGGCGGAGVRAFRTERRSVTAQPEETLAAPEDARSMFRRILLKLSGES